MCGTTHIVAVRRQMVKPAYTLPQHFKININIILPSIPTSSKWPLSLRFATNLGKHFSSASLCLKPHPPPLHYWTLIISGVDRDSSVGIVTGYGLDGPGIESLWRLDFPHPSRPALGPPRLLYNGYRLFPGGKGGWDVALITHPQLEPRLKKE